MEKLLIVDGMNLLFQMFYGMPARITGSHGKPIQGTLGFVGALIRILRWENPTHVAVLFDGETCNPRKDLEESYKANRPDYSQMPEEETPFSQLPDLYRALDYLGICHAETQACEADDWLAGYARQYGKSMEVVIVSYDSDLFQLIDDRVRILRYRGEKTVIWDRQLLLEKLGIRPEQYADYKSLTGDSADNIAGVPGVGPKTAARLLQSFGSLDALMQHPEKIPQDRLRGRIVQYLPRLQRNRLLIRLDGEKVLPFALEELKYEDAGFTTKEVLHGIKIT